MQNYVALENFVISMMRILKSKCRQFYMVHQATYMLIDGHKTETICTQCSGLESQFQAIQENNITKKADSTCYNFDFSYPHEDQLCPVCNAMCNLCGKHGHFAKVCQSKVNGIDQSRGNCQPTINLPTNLPNHDENQVADPNNVHDMYVYLLFIGQ